MRGGNFDNFYCNNMCPNSFLINCAKTTPNVRGSDEAMQSTGWKYRENVKQKHVSCQSASYHCEFCRYYSNFYLPNVKFSIRNNGHYTPMSKNGLNKEFYSVSKVDNMRVDCSNNHAQANLEVSQGREIHKTLPFQYYNDSKNPRSQQEITPDNRLFDRQFLLGEGVPEKLLKQFHPGFDNVNIKGSLLSFIFNNTNTIRYRIHRQLVSTKNLRDVSLRQFSACIKNFISIIIKKCNSSFLQQCVDREIIPKKFRKNINIEPRLQTKTIRRDCMNLSKHLMESSILDNQKDINTLLIKFKGHVWNHCRNMAESSKLILYEALIKIRNICALVCGVKHTRKINLLLQSLPHICVTTDNVIDVALKTDSAYVHSCSVQHFQHLYWVYRDHTLEDFRRDLTPLGVEGNAVDTLPAQIVVWEDYLSRVTASKSLIPEGRAVLKDMKDNWNKFLYGFRWGQNLSGYSGELACNTNIIDQNNYIPWQKPSVNLPTRSNPESEIFLATLKLTITEQINSMWDDHNSNSQDDGLTQQILQNFLDSNNFRVVSSDKTNRCLLMKNTVYIELGEKFLSDSKDYLLLARDPNKVILDRANSLINAVKKTNHTFKKGDLDRLIKYTPAPAKLSFLIKDHKQKDGNGNFPLRPLANINGSALDSLDWILSKILNQGVKLVKFHIWNTQQLLRIIPTINSRPIKPGFVRSVISLDVIGLYPSIPTLDAAAMVFRFVREHSEINTFGIPYPLVREIMNTMANNYNIEFNGRVYKQTKGVAMGARFSCSFSIIFMHIIESCLVEAWFGGQVLQDFELIYYGRYIDDTIIVFDRPVDQLDYTPILDRFNSLHRNINFTLELPDQLGFLPFLDTALYFNNQILSSKWFTKPQHSGNFIKGDEYMPDSVKRNTLIEKFRSVMVRSTELSHAREGINTVVKILLNNKHTLFKIMGAIRQAFYNNNYSITTPYVDLEEQSLYNFDWRIDKQYRFDNSIKEFEPPKPVLKIPYVGEQLKSAITETLRKFGRQDQVRVVFASNKRLKFLKPTQADNNNSILNNTTTPDYCIICQNIEGGGGQISM